MGLRIGIILGTKDRDYPSAIRRGVESALEGTPHTLVGIADLIPYHTHADPARYLRVALELASRLDLDATIVPVGCINGYLDGDEELAQRMLHILDPARTVVLERDVTGYRSITKDGRQGMRACMRHLIETCGLTRIAFVSGPETSVGAREREGIYLEEMAAHGLAIEEGMLVRGQFSGMCPEVFETVLDAHPDVQALCCATDLLAFTAYDVLRSRGLTVGVDVAVTGFDDHPSAGHIDPPLSTVHLTGFDYGQMAAREAIRLCEGTPQQEFTLSGTFLARDSCGERRTSARERYRALVGARPAPVERIAETLTDSTLEMATSEQRATFHLRMEELTRRIVRVWRARRADPDADDAFFRADDFSVLFDPALRDQVSLEGFHAAAVALLEALVAESPDPMRPWLTQQISVFHLHVSRLQSSFQERESLARDKQEWLTFRVAEGALLQGASREASLRLLLEELSGLGVRRADLFLLAEPVPVTGTKATALTDTMRHVAHLDAGVVELPGCEVSLQNLLSHVLDRHEHCAVCSLFGVMAGEELMGTMVIEAPGLPFNRQLMAVLNTGLALKHLQMIGLEREMNELLSKNNLLLERQSQRDEMSGLLNRRAVMDAMVHALTVADGTTGVVYYLDLDGLKYINDTFGHDAGDVALKAFAEVLRTRLPKHALIGRIGGDEFIAYCDCSRPEDAKAIKEDVLAGIDAYNEQADVPFSLAASIGYDVCEPMGDAAEALERSLARADERMYAEKQRHHASRAYIEAHAT